MQQLEMSRLESKRTLDQLEEARVQSNHQSILHSQLLNKIDIDSSLIQATHEKELSTIRSQLFASQQDKRIAEERLVREMEAMQGTIKPPPLKTTRGLAQLSPSPPPTTLSTKDLTEGCFRSKKKL